MEQILDMYGRSSLYLTMNSVLSNLIIFTYSVLILYIKGQVADKEDCMKNIIFGNVFTQYLL